MSKHHINLHITKNSYCQNFIKQQQGKLQNQQLSAYSDNEQLLIKFHHDANKICTAVQHVEITDYNCTERK